MLSYSLSPGHYMTLHHCHSCNPTIIATINALGKSDSIQGLKITDMCRCLLYDSSVDPALLAGVDDADDEDTSLAGVPVPNTTTTTTTDNDSDTESDHNSIDPNEADDNSSKASIHSTGNHVCIHHNILWMRKPIVLKIKPSWAT